MAALFVYYNNKCKRYLFISYTVVIGSDISCPSSKSKV